jgi:hypothetical protein
MILCSQQISLYDGNSHSTLEILWNYYRASLLISQAWAARLARVARDAASSSSTTLDALASDRQSNFDGDDIRDDIIAAIQRELCSNSIDEYVAVVDEAYSKGFIAQYSGFTYIGGPIVDPRVHRKMYNSMADAFPLIHWRRL